MAENRHAKLRPGKGQSFREENSLSFGTILRTILGEIRQYKKPSILAPVFTAGEVLMEVLLPYVMAAIIDQGIEAGNMQTVLVYGSVMLVLAFASLFCGTMAGRCAAEASCGLASNVRDDMYRRIQTYSSLKLIFRYVMRYYKVPFAMVGVLIVITAVCNLQSTFLFSR